MTAVIQTHNLTKRYKETLALDDVSLEFHQNIIYGLLGRNGAGKTTLMSILTAQNFATSGAARIYGEDPYENERVLQRMCFVRESQKYPEDATARHAFNMARLFFANWDQELADTLVEDFALPLKTTIKKLSRGQLSAVGVIIGLASRADITFFDEPYLGLDAVARQIFYDRLVADYAEFPRTIILSSHLIDEIAHLVEHVVVIDKGRIIVDESADSARQRAVTVTGARDKVLEVAGHYPELHRQELGNVMSLSVESTLLPHERQRAQEWGLEVEPVSLQNFVVRRTQKVAGAATDPATLDPAAPAHR